MRARALLIPALLLTAVPVSAQSAPVRAHSATVERIAQVSLTARIVVLDREALTRAGVSYVAVGSGRVRVESGRRLPAPFRARVGSGTLGVEAFLEAARESRWVRSEFTQQVLALSGAEARISSSTLRVGPYGSRSQGPALEVVPTVLADGRVHLRVRARVEDTVTDAWGYTASGDPVDAETEVVVASGQEAVLASAAASESARDAGLLRLGRAERGREVLVVITPRIVTP